MRSASFAVLAGLLAACSGGAAKVAYLKEKPALPSFVAVLPPDNRSTDMAAPDTTRRVVSEMLLALGMIPVVTPAQDEQLRGLGITDGGQLKARKPEELAAALGVDGLVYPVIERFNEINIGVYVNRMVEAQLALFDKSGERVWDVSGNGYNRAFNVTPSSIAQEAGKALARQAVGTQLEKMLKIHLVQEAQQMTGFMRAKLPEWPGTSVETRAP